MKRLLVGFIIVLLVVGGGLAVFWPINFWRLFDANMQPLALTEAEAFCVGLHGPETRWREHNPAVAQCITESDKGTVPNISQTPSWFCEGVRKAGLQISLLECISIVDSQQLWPLLEGGLTVEWNAAHPRPSVPEQVLETPSRRGERPSENRSDPVVP